MDIEKGEGLESIEHSIILDGQNGGKNWALRLQQTNIYETIFEEKNLLEIVRQVACYLHAEPKSIDELKGYGMRVEAANKGAIMHGVQWIQDHEIIIHPRCVNFITEISQYTWAKDKFGGTINKPVDSDNHLMDAVRARKKYEKE